jgi:bacteriochlorophyll 4-vinyl reductase
VRIEKNWFAEAFKGEVDYPVCTYLEGYFETLFSEIYGQKVKVEETLCSAKGDPYCEFRIIKY